MQTIVNPGSNATIQLPVIRTSDRVLFKRCRRKWNWQSGTRQNLQVKGTSIDALWFGTGFHFALEDYHGYNRFGNPVEAFRAYCKAFRAEELPPSIRELWPLGRDMLSYYTTYWLPRRNEFQTLWINNIPQCEVRFEIVFPGINYVLRGTFDRVVADSMTRLWVEDYKTAKKMDTNKLDTDPQITVYTLAANILYGRDFEGVLWAQFLKEVPAKPAILKSGEVSLNKSQHTTYGLYLETLKEVFGKRVPAKYVEFLNYLASSETPEGDRYIRWDLVRRNEYQLRSELQKFVAEAREMNDPNLALYPNPTRDCAWDCDFKSPCLAMDDGSDWDYMIELNYEKRQEESDTWRARIQYPDPLQLTAVVPTA